MFSLSDLVSIDTKHLWLKISSADQERARQQAQPYSNPIARYNAYVNQVCLSHFLVWLQDWLREESNLRACVFPSEESLPSIWEVVNGTAIQVGNTRIVLIPTESTDLETLCVPQEWVDIKSWMANYYIGVQVNLDDDDDCWMRVSGFATHRQLKNQGTYNEGDHTYSLAIEELTENLSLLFATLGLNLVAKVPEDVTLSEAVAGNLLKTFGEKSIYSPRLRSDIPFTQWTALISNEQWRQQLYDLRLSQVKNTSHIQDLHSSLKAQKVKLSQWFQNLFTEGWQPVDALLDTHLGNLAIDLRSYSPARKLSEKGGKLIDLGMQIGAKRVVLLLAISHEPEQKIGVLVQVHPTGTEQYLPVNLKLLLLESGNNLLEIKSRNKDCFIQLNHFKCLPGSEFSIKLVLNEFSITEEFLV